MYTFSVATSTLLVLRKLSSLRSQCATLLRWQWSSAHTIWYIITQTCVRDYSRYRMGWEGNKRHEMRATSAFRLQEYTKSTQMDFRKRLWLRQTGKPMTSERETKDETE